LEINFNKFIPTPKLGNYLGLQEFYDKYLPGNSTVNINNDNFIVHTSDLSVGIENCSLDISKSNVVVPNTPSVLPKLRTAMEFKRKPGLTENVLAMIKRNFNAPELMSVMDNEAVAVKVVDKLFSTVLTGSFDRSVIPSLIDFEEWYMRQEASTLGQIKNTTHMSALDTYKHIIKETPKAKLDLSIQSEYPALQTIIYHEKDVNALFGPIFAFLTERLLEMIDQNRFMIYTRKTVEDIENFFLGISTSSNLEVLELDISKYDKSQNDFHQAVEMLIWDRLGLDAILGEMWKRGHQLTTVKDYKAGIRTQLWYQRKSGDVTTFIGNTLIITACMASITDLDKCVKAAFCGDDSIVLFPKGMEYRSTMELAALQWNFNAKLLVKRHGYFCGKFIVMHESGCKVFPDPLKIITRLGNKNLRNEEHIEEMRVSLMDLTKSYGNSAYVHLLDDAFNEVYAGGGSCQYVLNCMWKIITDRNLFRDLFVIVDNGGCANRAGGKKSDESHRGRWTDECGKENTRRCVVSASGNSENRSHGRNAKGISEAEQVQRVEGKVRTDSSQVQVDNVRYSVEHEGHWGHVLKCFERNWGC